MRDAYPVKKYSLHGTQVRVYKRAIADSERRRIEREALEQFECPHCGETEPPFLDMFALDLKIECDGCGLPGALREFLK